MFFLVIPTKIHADIHVDDYSQDFIQVDYKFVAKSYEKIITRPFDFCSCVDAVKAWTGYDKPVGAARNWPINSDKPSVFGVVITSEGPVGHVAYILQVNKDSILVREANFKPCQVDTRIIPLNSKFIKGFYE